MWTCRLRRIREIGGRSYRLKNCLQWIGSSDGRCLWDAQRMAQMGTSSTPLMFRIRPRQSGRRPTSRVISCRSLSGGRTSRYAGAGSGGDCASLSAYDVGSTGSPQMIAFEELGDSSVLMSPNYIQMEHSQEMPADGSLFGVSPDTPGFVMHPAGTTQQLPGAMHLAAAVGI